MRHKMRKILIFCVLLTIFILNGQYYEQTNDSMTRFNLKSTIWIGNRLSKQLFGYKGHPFYGIGKRVEIYDSKNYYSLKCLYEILNKIKIRLTYKI